MSTRPCVRCSAPTDATLCWPCVDKLADALHWLTRLLPELHITITGQARTTRARPHAPLELAGVNVDELVLGAPLLQPIVHTVVPRPLPFDVDTADLYRAARRDLTRIVAELAAGHGVYVHAGTAAHPEAAVGWIRRNLRDLVRRDPRAGTYSNQLHRLRHAVEQAIDNHHPEVFAGRCDKPDPSHRICGAELHAHLGQTHVTCQACGARYEVAERRDFMLQAAREVWARSHVIAAALTAWNLPINTNTLDQWIARDRRWAEGTKERPPRTPPWDKPYPPILQVCTDYQDEEGRDVMEPWLNPDGTRKHDEDGVPMSKQAGRPQYRVGDVIDRVVWKMQHRQARLEETA